MHTSSTEYLREFLILDLYFPAMTMTMFSEFCVGQEVRDLIVGTFLEIKEGYKEMISGCGWLDDTAKGTAIRQIDDMGIHVVGPYLGEYIDPEVLSTENLLEYVMDCDRRQIMEFVGGPDTPNPGDWTLCRSGLESVTMQYNPPANSIKVLGGEIAMLDDILDGSDDRGLGALKYTLAHEISHGLGPWTFTSEYGMGEWMSPESYEEYVTRYQAVAYRFSGYEPLPGMHIIGGQVAEEMVADLMAMQCITAMMGDSDDARGIFTDIMRKSTYTYREQQMAVFLSYEIYPPQCYRINSLLQNFDEFHEAFGVEEGDGMWLAPEDRLRFW